MCLYHVRVRDLYHSHKVDNIFPCGKCPACLQAKANKRALRISNHHPDGFTAYFVTLHYFNFAVPYFRLSDLHHAVYLGYLEYGRLYDPLTDPAFCSIPIYRDSCLTGGKRSILSYQPSTILNPNYEIHQYLCHAHTTKSNGIMPFGLSGLRTKLPDGSFSFDSDKISCSYTPDFQNFIKRLRKNLLLEKARKIKARLSPVDKKHFRLSSVPPVPLSYYYAPEYGPTTQRFHIHAIIWLPSHYTEAQVKHHICKAWPYGSRSRTRNYVQVARNPESYVSSYVNKPADVSSFLVDLFPLRPSHSLDFGMDKDAFTFDSIVQNFLSSRCVTYTTKVFNESSATSSDGTFLLPKYVTYRYFPKFKGYNRCSSSTVRSVLLNASQYLNLSVTPSQYTESGEPLYNSMIRDVYGKPVPFSKSEASYTINFLNRALNRALSYGFTPDEYATLFISFHIATSSYLYRNDVSQYGNTSFYNISDVLSGHVDNSAVHSFLVANPDFDPDPNTFLQNVALDNRLRDKYYKNQKHRKLNTL
ncbi:replication initiator protein [Sigmofec virus UA08Rod_4104]|uniref:Replication initiator protein n=1 Tax=Sigmofec virus UA08Rod_4104 TaxID=2929394 RepID=A0A976N1U9_9VIRU|nr:replication initiator protein [Sigmofec virus UA08Rod_4104]